MLQGKLYDGVTGHPYEVFVSANASGLSLSRESGWSEEIGSKYLKRLESDGISIRLARTDFPGWRLILPADAEPVIAGAIGRPDRYGRWIDRIGLVPALIAGGILTASVVGIGYLAPNWIAPHIPMSWERNVGGAIVGDFGDLRCRNAEGQRALEALVERVAPGATKGSDGIKVAALDVSIFNAAALPGGYIVVFKPAITETDSEALAGILAHEVAHVRRRHVTEALIREMGIGALIRLFAGDLGANAEQIVSLNYTRSNEAQADSDAIAMLKRANISPKPTAALFTKLADEQHEGVSSATEFLQSHPMSRKRAQNFAASFDPRSHYSPVLTRDQSDALFNICWKGRGGVKHT